MINFSFLNLLNSNLRNPMAFSFFNSEPKFSVFDFFALFRDFSSMMKDETAYGVIMPAFDVHLELFIDFVNVCFSFYYPDILFCFSDSRDVLFSFVSEHA